MKYAVIQNVNGNFSIVSEWSDLSKAIMSFHTVCSTLWNSADVSTATIEALDEKLHAIKVEYIDRSEARLINNRNILVTNEKRDL